VQLNEGPDGRNWAELDELAEALATWMLKGGLRRSMSPIGIW